MVGVGGSSPLGRTIHLISSFLFICSITVTFLIATRIRYKNAFLIHNIQAAKNYFFTVAQQLSDFSDMNMLICYSFKINFFQNHFLIHFTEISLYNTPLSLVEWFQPINLPNPEKIADD